MAARRRDHLSKAPGDSPTVSTLRATTPSLRPYANTKPAGYALKVPLLIIQGLIIIKKCLLPSDLIQLSKVYCLLI